MELEKGKSRKESSKGFEVSRNTFLLAKKANMKFLKFSPKLFSCITKRQKTEV